MTFSDMKIIALDVDDVLANNMGELVEWHNSVHGTVLRREDFRAYRFWKVWGGTRDEAIEKYYSFMEDRGEAMPLVQGAREGVERLSKTYELIAVTSRQQDFHDLTKSWIRRNFGSMIRKVYSTNSYDRKGGDETKKSDVLRDKGVGVLVDDQLKHTVDCAGKGIRVLLYDNPWNQVDGLPENVERVFSWDEIVGKLII